MVEAGEDPLFIARRMVIFASEDIGLAQPTALVVANAVFRACETIGYPECAINLAHGVAYLSQCKKDRSTNDAYFSALDDVKKLGNLPVPLKIRNAPTKLMRDLGYGKGYEKYPTASSSPRVQARGEDAQRAGEGADFLPEKLKGRKYL
jgi:putative ATPase